MRKIRSQLLHPYRYESMFSRLIKYFKPKPNTGSHYHEDLATRSSQKLSENLPYQYPLDETKPKEKVPITKLEEKLMVIENEKERSLIFKSQMEEIDKVLGTNTIFHEVALNEERLDSEFVMERKMLNNLDDGQEFSNLVMNRDPQEKIIPPKIRNFNEYVKEVYNMRTYPEHLKENYMRKTDHDSWNDFYEYLNISGLNKQLFQNKLENVEKNNDFKKYMDFVGQELMYLEYSLAKNSRLETQLTNEYYKYLDVHSVRPMHYSNYVYFSKDPKIDSKSHNDIYRRKVNNNSEETVLENIEDASKIELIITEEEILNFLLKKFPTNEEIFDFVHEIQTNKSQPLFYDISFDKKHEIIIIILKIGSTYLTMFKFINNNKISEKVLLGVEDLLINEDKGIYYIKENELGRGSFLMYWKLNENDDKEICIYEEKDFKFKLRMEKISNPDFGLLISEQIAGIKINEIGIMDLNSINNDIKKIFNKNQNLYWKLRFNENDFFFKKSNEQIIYKISKNPLKQNKIQLLIDNEKELTNVNEEDKNNKIIFENTKEILKLNEETLLDRFLSESNYEKFYEAEKNEKIINFDVFKHYIIIHLKKNMFNEYFKIYNCKTESFHTLKITDSLYNIETIQFQRYETQYFTYLLKCFYKPEILLSYNMAMREIKTLHIDNYFGLNLENVIFENVEAESRDKTKIPLIFIYNKNKVSSNSSVILLFEDPLTIEFQHEFLLLFDRGFIIAIPQIRGSRMINEEWTSQGSELRKMTMICDYIDSAAFILKNEIAKKVFAFGRGHIGGFITICSLLREPNIFSGAVIDNGVFNILEYVDKERNDQQIVKLFGNLHEKEIYFLLKSLNPYNLDKISLQNLLITCDIEDSMVSQSRKFVAKCRENKENTDIYFREYGFNTASKEKIFKIFAFIIDLAFRS